MHKQAEGAVSDRITYFFDSGLRFSCQQCGECCTGEPGTIYVTSLEITSIADFLHLSIQDFTNQALYPYRDSYTIKERPDGACLFYDTGCIIYPVRPAQCRSFPFWLQTLRSPYAWKQTAKTCPGIGYGRLFSREEILAVLESSPP